jgi:hypothetical protein
MCHQSSLLTGEWEGAGVEPNKESLELYKSFNPLWFAHFCLSSATHLYNPALLAFLTLWKSEYYNGQSFKTKVYDSTIHKVTNSWSFFMKGEWKMRKTGTMISFSHFSENLCVREFFLRTTESQRLLSR